MENEKVRVDLPSKIYLTLSDSIYSECYCNYDEAKWFSFNNKINPHQLLTDADNL